MLRLRDFKLCVIRIRCPVCSTCDCFDSRPLVHNYVSSFLHFSPMRLCVSFARRFKKTRNWWLLRLPAHFFWTLTIVCRVNNALNRNTEIDERACFRVLSICAFDQFLSKFLRIWAVIFFRGEMGQLSLLFSDLLRSCICTSPSAALHPIPTLKHK